MVAESKELERFSRKGKVVSQEEDGNIAIELRRKRWEKGFQQPKASVQLQKTKNQRKQKKTKAPVQHIAD